MPTPPVSGEPTPTRANAAAAKAKAKAEAKAAAKAAAAKAKAHAKAASALKNRAAALRRRLVTALNGLRSAISHPLILEVPASMSEKVKSYLHAFERMISNCDLVIAGAADELDEALNEVPWKEVKAAEKLLFGHVANPRQGARAQYLSVSARCVRETDTFAAERFLRGLRGHVRETDIAQEAGRPLCPGDRHCSCALSD